MIVTEKRWLTILYKNIQFNNKNKDTIVIKYNTLNKFKEKTLTSLSYDGSADSKKEKREKEIMNNAGQR